MNCGAGVIDRFQRGHSACIRASAAPYLDNVLKQAVKAHDDLAIVLPKLVIGRGE